MASDQPPAMDGDEAEQELAQLSTDRQRSLKRAFAGPLILALLVSANSVLLFSGLIIAPWLSIASCSLQFILIAALLGWTIRGVLVLFRDEKERESFLVLMTAVAASISGFVGPFMVLGIEDSQGIHVHDLAVAFYFSVVTITTLGYGDYHPHGWSLLFSATEALIGYVLLGMTVGIIVSYLAPKGFLGNRIG